MKRPLVFFTLSFALGILAAPYVGLKFYHSYIAAFACLFFSLFARKGSLPVFFLAFSLGLVLFKNSYTLASCHIAKAVAYKSTLGCVLKGTLDSNPQVNSGRTHFIFKAGQMQSGGVNRRCCGRVIVILKGENDLSYGQEAIIKGRLYPPFNFAGSRSRSYRDYLRRQDIWFKMNINNPADFRRTGKNKGVFLKKLACRLQKTMENALYRELSPLAASFLSAIILGKKSAAPAFIKKSMVKSGTVHILVVSGFHVGVVAFALLLFLKMMRLPKKIRFALAIPLLIFYSLVSGGSLPAVRATVMAVTVFLAYLLMREPDIYSSLSASALFILCLNPRQLFDAGFQLSFASVLSLACIYPKIRALVKIEALKAKWLAVPIDGLLVSFSAWLGTVGLVVYYFRVISLIAVFANLIIVPLAAFIALSGFSLVFLSFSAPFLLGPFASAVEFSVAMLIGLNSFLVKLPYAHLSFN